MGNRRKARELAVQILFCQEFLQEEIETIYDRVCEHFAGQKAARVFVRDLVLGVMQKKGEIDGLIRRSSKHWRLERMPRLDRSILRLAVFEMLYREDIPPKVTIDEAVELGKRFGNVESGKFINGILDDLYNALERKTPKKDQAARQGIPSGKNLGTGE